MALFESCAVQHKQKILRRKSEDFCGGALSTALEPEFIPDTAADSKHLAAHGESPQSCFHR